MECRMRVMSIVGARPQFAVENTVVHAEHTADVAVGLPHTRRSTECFRVIAGFAKTNEAVA